MRCAISKLHLRRRLSETFYCSASSTTLSNFHFVAMFVLFLIKYSIKYSINNLRVYAADLDTRGF